MKRGLVVGVFGLALAAAGASSPAAGQMARGFTLTNIKGRAVPADHFTGRYMLVYFGYTHCPETCPTVLSRLSRALTRLGRRHPETASSVVPVFISVDPARDSPQRLRTYLQAFRTRIVGLTGSPSSIRDATRALGAYAGEPGSGERYTVNHAALLYLIGPTGEFVAHFNRRTDVPGLVSGLRRHVRPDRVMPARLGCLLVTSRPMCGTRPQS